MAYTFFELNYSYHSQVSFKDKCNIYLRSSSANELVTKLGEQINIYCQNLLHTYDLQKQVHDKKIKPWSYTIGEKVWPNSKYIKAKQN